MKTRHCEECKHDKYDPLEKTCKKGHKPRFYMPRSPMDRDWGWKRKCEDFEDIAIRQRAEQQDGRG